MVTVDYFRKTDGGIELLVHVQPRAARTEVVGLHGDALKVRLQAPPVEGAANRMCQAFLAEQLGLRRSEVQIVAGQASHRKRIRISVSRTDVPALEARLRALVQQG